MKNSSMQKILKITVFLLILISLSSCSNKINLMTRSFGNGSTPGEICQEQGISSKNSQFEACKKFYNSQNFSNRNNILLGAMVAIISGALFQRECNCLFGPGRGEKFER